MFRSKYMFGIASHMMNPPKAGGIAKGKAGVMPKNDAQVGANRAKPDMSMIKNDGFGAPSQSFMGRLGQSVNNAAQMAPQMRGSIGMGGSSIGQPTGNNNSYMGVPFGGMQGASGMQPGMENQFGAPNIQLLLQLLGLNSAQMR